MGNIPLLSGQEVVRAFEKLVSHVARRRASHIVMIKEVQITTLSVPDHKEIAKGTLRSLIRSAKLTTDEFLAAI